VTEMAYSGTYRPPGGKTEPKKPPFLSGLMGKQSPITGPIAGTLEGILKKLEGIDLDTDDLLMMLILYLMYRESGDKELLVMLGAMLLS